MDIKNALVLLAAAFFLLLVLRQKRRLVTPAIVAFCIAFIWTWYYRYEYVGSNVFLFGAINVYPLVLWTVGLTALHAADSWLARRRPVILPIVLYFALLAAFEAVGYHMLGIQLASDYTSLLDLGVIHAPPVMKIFYVLVGPLYIITLRLLQTPRAASRR